MKRLPVLLLVGLALLLQCAPLFAYGDGPEGINSPQMVKEIFGDNPIAKIREVVPQRKADYTTWKKAVAAACFLGEDGAQLLFDQLSVDVANNRYDVKTTKILESLGRIVDERAVKGSLMVLGSKSPQSLKLLAAQIARKQFDEMSWTVSDAYILNRDGITIASSGSTFGKWTEGESYSNGQEIATSEAVLAYRGKFAELLPELKKQNAETAEAVRKVMATIDNKEQTARMDLERRKQALEQSQK